MQQVKVNNTPNKTKSKHRGWDLLTLLACSREQHYHTVWQHEGRAQRAQSLQDGRETEWALASQSSKHDSPAQCFASAFLSYFQHLCLQDAQLLRLVKSKRAELLPHKPRGQSYPLLEQTNHQITKNTSTQDIIVMFSAPFSIPFQTEYWILQEQLCIHKKNL